MRGGCLLSGFLLAALAGPLAAQVNADGAPNDLRVVYRAALDNNHHYQAALDEYRATAEAKPQALARLLPRLSLEGQYNRIRRSIDGNFYGVQDVEREDIYNRYAYGASLLQPIYRRELLLGLDRAELEVSRARLRLTAARHNLMVRSAEAYFGMLSAQDDLTLIRAEKAAIERQYEQTQGRFDSGLIAETDLQAVEAQRDSVLAEEIAAENTVEIAQTRLELLTGRSIERIASLPEDANLPPMENENLQSWLAKADQHNLDLLAATVGLRLAELDTTIARSARLPTLDLVGSHLYFDADDGVTGEREDEESRIGLMLTIPLYEGGMVSSRVRQAQARAESQAHTTDGARSNARLATRTAFLNARSAHSRANALVRAVDSARSAEASAQVAFEVGSRTAADYLGAVRARFSAERDLSRARYNYLLGLLRLREAAGVVTVTDLENLNRTLQ